MSIPLPYLILTLLLIIGSIILTYQSRNSNIAEIKVPGLPPYILYSLMWIITYAILLYVWIKSDKILNWPALNVLILINIILNFLWIYVFFTLRDPEISFIISILLVSSTIGIIIKLWSQTSLRNLLFINVAWLLFLTFTNYRINSYTMHGTVGSPTTPPPG